MLFRSIRHREELVGGGVRAGGETVGGVLEDGDMRAATLITIPQLTPTLRSAPLNTIEEPRKRNFPSTHRGQIWIGAKLLFIEGVVF